MALPTPPGTAPQTETVTETVQPTTTQTATADAVAEYNENVAIAEPPQETAASVVPATPTGGAIATHTGGGGVMNELAEEGFEGLELGFGSVPMIVLDKTMWRSKDLGDFGDHVMATIQSTKPKMLLKAKNADSQPNPKDFLRYSYDNGVNTTKGEPVEELIQSWGGQGNVERKVYLDVTVSLTEGEHAGKLCIISVPPTSKSRISGHLAGMVTQGMNPKQVPTRFGIGKEVTTVPKPFFPMSFEVAK